MKSDIFKGIAIGLVAGAGIGMVVKSSCGNKRTISKTAKSISNAIDSIGSIFGF